MSINVYVDGSWKKGSPDISGWAYVILDRKEETIIKEQSGVVKALSRQIDGELEATLKSIKALSSLEYRGKANLYYDYIGIEKWAKGEWKAKSEIAQRYVKAIQKLDLSRINFVKVKSHTGDNPWNDYVDEKAKERVDKFNFLRG